MKRLEFALHSGCADTIRNNTTPLQNLDADGHLAAFEPGPLNDDVHAHPAAKHLSFSC